MSPAITKYCLGFVMWGLVLTGTLSIANWPGHWGHSVCGIWGCGPPLQALVSWHVSWLVVLVPAAVGIHRFASIRALRRTAVIGLLLALTGALGIAAYEYQTWYAEVSNWQRSFFLRRVGFVMLTTVELPLLEIGGISIVVLLEFATRLTSRTRCNRYRGVAAAPNATLGVAGTESSNSTMAPDRE